MCPLPARLALTLTLTLTLTLALTLTLTLTRCDSVPHLMIAMRGLARFHARWWGAAQKKPLDVFHHPTRGGGPLPYIPRQITLTAFALTIKVSNPSLT